MDNKETLQTIWSQTQKYTHDMMQADLTLRMGFIREHYVKFSYYALH
jgi:hypothetical protein